MFLNIREAGSCMHQIGFLCNDKLIANIDDELLLLAYDSINNRFANASKLEDDVTVECREIDVNVDQLYTTKYYPRVYYIIYKLQFNGNVGYLLERYDGTSASSDFYPCPSYEKCRNHVEMFEDI